VSVRPEGREAFGTKVEIKNMNSFRSLERAVDFEIERQVAEIEGGGEIVQETRHWDEADGRTHGMRTKEGSSDYRYFTEPDLPPMHLDDAWVAPIRETLPELPAARATRYAELGIDHAAAAVLAGADEHTRSILEAAIEQGVEGRRVGLWLTQDVAAWLNREGRELATTPLEAAHLAELASLADEGALSSSGISTALGHVLAGEGGPREVAEAHDLIQISDEGALEAAVDAAIAEHPDEWQRYVDGERKLTGFFVGQVMRATGGKADPKIVSRLLAEKS
jgi:aspartyl-tRNA(Asn)/glutamyl-tRNA(Gln) amidotransferase subunit B